MIAFFIKRPVLSMLLVIFIVCFGTVAIAMKFRKTQRPWTCADYANFPREHVPARCFGDFKPNAQ